MTTIDKLWKNERKKSNMKKIILSIEGMTCSACSNGLEKYLNKQDGIKQASVNLVMANASIEYDEKKLNIDNLNEFVKKAGFKSLGEFKEIKIEGKSKKEKIIFIIFTILAIIFMYIAMGHMVNLPTLEIIDVNKNPIGYTICLFIFAILFIIYGFDVLKNGYKNLIHKTPNMDTLVGIGVLSSFIYSIYSMFLIIRGETHVVHNLYFESAAMVIYFVKLGRYLDGISKDKTKEAIQKLVKITPESATIKVDGKEKTVTIDEVKKGDIVVSKPGERISVDGKILEGKAHLDESFITGESNPVKKENGKTVMAGSINYEGTIKYEAQKIGKNSTVSEIVKLVVDATSTKAPIAKIADKIILNYTTTKSLLVPIEKISDEEKEELLPIGKKKFIIEKSSAYSWYPFAYNDNYLFTINRFGYSGKASDINAKFNFTSEEIALKIEEIIK